CNSCQALTAKQLVEEYHADVNFVGDGGMTPLHEAMNSADMEIAKMLIENKADVNARDLSRNGFTDGWTSLHYAVSHAAPEMIKYLLEHGADANIKNCLGQTPAEMARQGKNQACVAMATLIDQLTGVTPLSPRERRRQQYRPKP
ncbi:MAG: ankyrin repeat domain-containing protein, partial [Proteobacteria bacterium]|nr:ankyrin repeat domain-containing protein [Pseudomonadota bacterium]